MAQKEDFLQAFDQLSDGIFRYCYFRVYDRETALDLVQETFMKTWQHMAAGHEVRNLKAFVYQVAKNSVIDYFRSKKALSLEELQEQNGFDPGLDSREQLSAQIDAGFILKLLEKVEEPYRTAVYLRYTEDLSPQEIAEITGETANVVSVRIHRGLEYLRTIVKRESHESQ
ncbi:MAG TPA: sigma-70 family RNA polymerase sigma factor [Patescibacteria group bacterium]|nr:sigma-70 family RNA polymerase sigma factor [Patescibacteria group bacterium]